MAHCQQRTGHKPKTILGTKYFYMKNVARIDKLRGVLMWKSAFLLDKDSFFCLRADLTQMASPGDAHAAP
jgi:hypothetical protein